MKDVETSIFWLDDTGDISRPVQNSEHFDGVFYLPVKDDVRRNHEAA